MLEFRLTFPSHRPLAPSLRVAIGFAWQILLVVVVAVAAGIYSDYLVPLGVPPIPPNVRTWEV